MGPVIFDSLWGMGYSSKRSDLSSLSSFVYNPKGVLSSNQYTSNISGGAFLDAAIAFTYFQKR